MFVFNADHHLIAADPQDLERLGYADIYEAARAFVEGTMQFDPREETLGLSPESKLSCSVERLESLLGSWYLVRIPQENSHPQKEEEKQEEEEKPSLSVEEALGLTELIPEDQEKETPEEEVLTLELLEEPSSQTKKEKEEKIEPREASRDESCDEEEVLSLLETPEEDNLPISDEKTPHTEEHFSLSEHEEELLPILDEEVSAEKAKEEAEEASLQPINEKIEEDTKDEELLLILEEESAESGTVPEEEDHSLQIPVTESSLMEIEEHPIKEEKPEKDQEENREEPLMKIPESPEGPWEKIIKRFHPDLDANAREIDLRPDEYRELIEEFIQDSRQLSGQLLSDNPSERGNAISVLKDAIALLHLSPLDELLGLLEDASPQERLEIVSEYETVLGGLSRGTAIKESENVPSEAPELSLEVELHSDKADSQNEHKEIETIEVSEKELPKAQEEIAAISTETSPVTEEEAEVCQPQEQSVNVDEFLRGVQPIPIEFSLHIAAQELSLPEDLVLEFINDFDKQGHEYLPVLIDAYQRKDLPHLQKTAHMLKGAASNLRIEAMVDNLYALQYDNDIERAPERIRLFAGQLMSLDKYLEQMSSQGG